MFTTRCFRVVCLALVILPAGLVSRPARGDEDNRTILAREVLELTYSPGSLRDSFGAFLQPVLNGMKRDGLPDAAQEEVRKAFLEWFNQEVRWDDIKPKLVQVYAQDYTEEELWALVNFLKNPLGQKVIAKVPLVMHDCGVTGQGYFASKQDSLNAKLAPILAKYRKAGN